MATGRGAAARRETDGDGPAPRAVPRPKPAADARDESRAEPGLGAAAPSPTNLDRPIHERLRLGIVSALAVNDALGFNDLKSLLGATDGNLSVHARKLEDAGFGACTKSFGGRVPRTEFRLASGGAAALRRYGDHMEALIRMAKGK